MDLNILDQFVSCFLSPTNRHNWSITFDYHVDISRIQSPISLRCCIPTSLGQQIAASSQPNRQSIVESYMVPVTSSLQEGGFHLRSAFFYGTLMHPAVLRRVIRNDGSHLVTAPAVLYSYIRRGVKRCDYPAIIASGSSDEQSSKEQPPCVRGVLVRGLTALDLSYLDSFEEDEYVREKVVVSALGHFQEIPQAELNPPRLDGSEVPCEVPAWVYVWNRESTALDPGDWSYDDFVAQKLASYTSECP